MENNTQYIEEDKIDLRELFAVLKRRKKLIWSITGILTVLAIVYAFFIAKPIYKGSAILEVGQIVNEQFNEGKYSSLLDNLDTLKELISVEIGTVVSIPKKTNIISISYTNTDKSIIKKKIEEAIVYVLDRHKKLAKLYSGQNSRVKMTQLVGDITIGDTAIKPKKKLIVIVAFITGLMLSVFLAFFLEFIGGMKKEETSE